MVVVVVVDCCECEVDLRQWNGAVSIEVLERGKGWWHVIGTTSSIDSRLLILGKTQAVIDDQRLGEFAMTDTEHALLARINVSSLLFPRLLVGLTEFNSGNELLGMLRLGCKFFAHSLQ